MPSSTVAARDASLNVRAFIGLLLLVEVIMEAGFLVDTSWVDGFSLKNGLLYGLLLLSLNNLVRAGRQLPRPAVQALIAFLFLCGWTALTALWVTVPPGADQGSGTLSALTRAKQLVVDSAAVFAVFTVGMGQRVNFSLLSRCLVVILALFCALALFEVRSPGESIYGASHEMTRNRGPFGEVNQTAAIIAMMVPIAVAWSVRMRGLWRVVLASSAAVMLGSMLLTGSRGGILAALVAVTPLLLALHREGRLSQRLLLLIALPVVGVVAWSVLPDASRLMVTERFLSLRGAMDDATRTSAGRIFLWQIALKLWPEKPIFGFGWGYYQSLVGNPTHNEYLMYLVDSGIVGAVLYLMVWASVLLLVRRARQTLGGDALILSAFHGSVLGAMTGAFFVNFYKPGLFMWGVIGLIAGQCCQGIRAAQAPDVSAGERFGLRRSISLRRRDGWPPVAR